MGQDYIINSKLEEIISSFQDAKLALKEATLKKDENPVEYHKSLAEYNKFQDQLAYVFYTLSENIINAFNFRLIDHDDALQEGVLIALQKVDRFDHTYVGKDGKKAKAFNYMTTCILNHFRQQYRSAKSQIDLQYKYYHHLINKMDFLLADWNNGQSRAKFVATGHYGHDKDND